MSRRSPLPFAVSPFAISLFVAPWIVVACLSPAVGQDKPANKEAAANNAAPNIDTRRGDTMFAAYFAAETAKLEGRVLDGIKTKEDWLAQKDELRRQLHEMLGLDPLPERTPLNPVVTGTLDHAEFTVEKLHFQSSPGLYVTGNLYVPKGLTKPAPAILYVCGHGNTVKNGVSYGSKSVYQHHGAWFARHGFICLIVDTLQLAEIQGLHHGTYHKGMFWWYSRGYTPAGVEAWNGIRALDYLQSRKDVDGTKLGVTGRSGGGASSWWIAALDERIKAAVPVAGITDLKNHVVDGVVEGHCDCMFMVNTYQWDYATVASLIAPRALLLTNTDDDRIFPLDGVERVHWQTKKIYGLLGAQKDLGLQISWGGHYDTQELQVAAFRWFFRHLKGEDPKISIAAVKFFEPEQLKVFDKLPEDQRNTTAHEWFVPTAAKPKVPSDANEWAVIREGWMKSLREKTFRAWPDKSEPLEVDERRRRIPLRHKFDHTISLAEASFVSQGNVRLSTVFNVADTHTAERVEFVVVDNESFTKLGKDLKEDLRLISADERSKSVELVFACRGIDDTMWDQSPKKQTQHRRRFYLLGQTLEGQQVYDMRRAIQSLRQVPELKDAKVTLRASGAGAPIALYAALFEPSVDRLELTDLPKSHMPQRSGPTPQWSNEILKQTNSDYGPSAAPLFNVLKTLDMPQAVALAAERATVKITTDEPEAWQYPVDVAKSLGWKDRVVVTKK